MKIIYTEEFKGDVRKVKDKKIQDRLKKIVQKLKDNPEVESHWDMIFLDLEVLDFILLGCSTKSGMIW